MFHRKPLYVAIAQRKEERHAQLQLQYVQRMAGLAAGTSTTVIPSGYPPLYYTAPSSVLSHVHPRPGLMYQPFGLRPGWRGNGFAPPTRPALQPSTLPVVSLFSTKQSNNPVYFYEVLLFCLYFLIVTHLEMCLFLEEDIKLAFLLCLFLISTACLT